MEDVEPAPENPDLASSSVLSPVRSEGDLAKVCAFLRTWEKVLQAHHPGSSLEQEIASLPGEYAPPLGRIFLLRSDGDDVGCVVLRPLSGDACEMRRLFILPEYRGRGIGKRAVVELCAEARRIGFRSMRLLTVPFMREAIGIYRSLGFRETVPYRETKALGPIYFELDLGD